MYLILSICAIPIKFINVYFCYFFLRRNIIFYRFLLGIFYYIDIGIFMDGQNLVAKVKLPDRSLSFLQDIQHTTCSGLFYLCRPFFCTQHWSLCWHQLPEECLKWDRLVLRPPIRWRCPFCWRNSCLKHEIGISINFINF